MQWTATEPAPDRVLIVGWPSFLHGEATTGDVLAMEAARTVLSDAGLRCDLAWSPVFRPGGRTLEDSPPEDYAPGVHHARRARGLRARPGDYLVWGCS